MMDGGEKGKGLAILIANARPKKKSDDSEGSSDKFVGLMEEFESADGAEAKAAAMKAFVKACMSGYGDKDADEDYDEE